MEAAQCMASVAIGGCMKPIDFTAHKKAAERKAYSDLVMTAWDRQNPKEREAQRIGKPDRLDTDADVRRKAKEQL